MRNCGKCHTCGNKVRYVLDGEEWCDHCKKYQRPHSHGWGWTKYASASEQADTCEEAIKIEEARRLANGT